MTSLCMSYPRIVALCDALERMYTRCSRPMIVSETSGLREGRPDGLRDVREESLAAMHRGIGLHGIRLFPAIDMPDWHAGDWLHNGIRDLVDDAGRLRRVPFAPCVDALRRWQRLLHRVTELDEDPFSDAVELEDVVRAAKRFDVQADRNRHRGRPRPASGSARCAMRRGPASARRDTVSRAAR